MQTADMANARPRVLIRVSQGFVSVHSSSELTLTVADDDLQVRCDNANHLCSEEELVTQLQRISSYRHDPFFSQTFGSRK